jgi:hypothetical protein
MVAQWLQTAHRHSFDAGCCLRHPEKVTGKFLEGHEIIQGLLGINAFVFHQPREAHVVHSANASILKDSVLPILDSSVLGDTRQTPFGGFLIFAPLNTAKISLGNPLLD